jgi:glycine dehydrogenase subunit 1
MLKAIGAASVEELFEAIPASIRGRTLQLPEPLSEAQLISEMHRFAESNRTAGKLFLGAGAYEHFIPAAVGALVSRGEFLTAYTPYQPEVSQGTLQAAFEFQSLICELLGMEVANSSLYDGASALAEAALMANRLVRNHRFWFPRRCIPLIAGCWKPTFSRWESRWKPFPRPMAGSIWPRWSLS